MNLSAQLREEITKVVYDLFKLTHVDFVIEHPENDEFGDFATNVAMVISKTVKQPPMAIAKNVAYRLKDIFDNAAFSGVTRVFSDINVANPGFINFKISKSWLLNILTEEITLANNYGVEVITSQNKVALEHSNVNPNKAAHIGHLRNACIGQFIEKIYELQGFDVHVQYYCNDVGVQAATSAMGIEKIKDISPTSYKKYDHYAWDVYAKMESLIADDIDLQNERFALMKELDNPKSVVAINQKKIAHQILLEQLRTFAKLGIDYDIVINESDILGNDLWKSAFDTLKSNEHVYKATEGASAGCWLVRMGPDRFNDAGKVPEHNSDIEQDKIIVRSNGIPTYTGKDIAYHLWKFGLLDVDFRYVQFDSGTQSKQLWMTSSTPQSLASVPAFKGSDIVLDVIGVEQTYAMDAVKKAISYLGYEKQSQSMKHINYGFVYVSRNTAKKLGIDVSDGKKFYGMSGRKGWGVKIDDLIDLIDSSLVEQYGESASTAMVRNAAIKFQMLKLNTFQDLIFDLDDALDLKGFSGPYIQYACVRANAVLKKAEYVSGNKDFSSYDNLTAHELSILRLLSRYTEIIKSAAESYSPNILCDYLFVLSKKYNAFYNDTSILKAETTDSRDFRLELSSKVSQILASGLSVLGISVPSAM